MAQSSHRWTEDIQGREEQRHLKREALLQTAARIFNQVGFHQTTLDDLAKALNVTKPTLYYYVKNKDDILFECQRLALERLQGILELTQGGFANMHEACHNLVGTPLRSDRYRAFGDVF